MTVISRKRLRFLSACRQVSLFQLFKRFSNSSEIANFDRNPLRKRVRPPYLENDTRIANRICLTILGNGAIGQPRCVGLFTDVKSYLFNCGEGVSRLCREYEINMWSIKHVFVTQKKWENVSGISDIFLAHQTSGTYQLSLHGPPGIELYQTLVSAKQLDTVLYKKPSAIGSHIDHTLEIEYVPIKCENNPNFRNKRKKHAGPLNGSSGDAFSYICNIFEKPGGLILEKCVEHGVPVGPDLLKLKNGEDVVLPSGKIIYSKDVNNPSFPRTLILVVDCPSESFLEPFISEQKFQKCFAPFNMAVDIPAVFHFTPPEIFSSAKYQDWIHRFPKNTLHFALNSDNPTASSNVVHKVQKILHLMDKKIFDILQEKEAPSEPSSCDSNILHPPPMLQFHMRPERKLSWSNVVKVNYTVDVDDIYDLPNLRDFFEKLGDLQLNSDIIRKSLLNDEKEKNYPEVVFLGTSSSTAIASRNVSGILINTSPHNSILLDCGEGTMMQLARYYGHENVHSVLRKISCIFISHKHTDHYLGLFEILTQRIKAFESTNNTCKRVALILPSDTALRLKSFCEIYENIFYAVKIFRCNKLEKEHCNDLKSFLGNIELSTVPVQHCYDAHGVVVQLGSEWKIVYSGDTEPCQRLIDAGQDCTLLIHEATVEDNFAAEALAKKHSTLSQAADVAEKMNAKYTILTHFSKRYLAIPVLEEYNHRCIGYAFDFMKTRLCDLPLLPLFIPLVKCLFQDQLEEYITKSSNTANFEKTFLKVLKS